MDDDINVYGSRRAYAKKQKKQIFIFVVLAIIIAILAFIIGYVSKSSTSASCKAPISEALSDNSAFHKSIVDSMMSENIENNLKYFAKLPHAASSERNNELMKEIHRRFQSYGFEATDHPYDVLLSFPNPKKRNYVYVLDKDNTTIYQSKGIEDFLEPSEQVATGYPSFLGYAPKGTVQGEVVYANYGRVEDFDELIDKLKVNVSGKIVIARYGKIFRGNKVANAQSRGAIGVILYSDPFDTAPIGEKFIKGRWLPDDGVQRGSILNTDNEDIGQGDPLTPGYPSKDWAYHADMNKIKGLPTIPAQPVSAEDAFNIMSHMGGPMPSQAWKGKLNISYNVGPYKNTTMQVKVEVFNSREVKTITNVCGTIVGKVEPDRYVFVGNHVDAWVFGGVDPSSGTSVMMEMARALSEKVKTGWRPRRTIKLCGWDGEEYGLIGSSEYVEENRNQLRDRAVAYINLDSAVSGNESLGVAGSPLLHKMMFDVHKKVGDPFDESISVFDKMKQVFPDKNYPEKHRIHSLGSGSDYTSFYQFLGIPSSDMGYGQFITNARLNISSYPVYHSLHDTYYWLKHFVDKDFTVHLTVGRVAMYYLLNIADSLVVPFDAQRYGELLSRNVKEMQKRLETSAGSKVDPAPLVSAASNFTEALDALAEKAKAADLSNPIELRMLNDRLIQLEKGFIYVDGLPGRQYLKHYIMAPSKYNSYGSSQFPAISDTIVEAEKTGDWDQVNKQLSITAYLIQNVAETLRS